MSASLLRTAPRVAANTPLRVTPYFVRKPLGSYPVPTEAKIWWKNRYQCPGGQIMNTVSPYQQKVMWQYFWGFPSRWLSRFQTGWINAGIPFVLVFTLYLRSKHVAEEDFRTHYWF